MATYEMIKVLLAAGAKVYRVCPKCRFERRGDDASDPGTCPACGLVFAKWVGSALGRMPPARRKADDGDYGWLALLAARIFYVEPHAPAPVFWGRALLYVVFFLWGWSFIVMESRNPEIMQSFMHRIDLVFHEAGHVLFMPFGRFMTILGGSLAQLIMPVVAMCALIVTNRDNFGASLALWWLGQSFMDLAPYIADARALQLPLLGGGTGADRPGSHDWENLLLDLNLIHRDLQIGSGTHILGAAIMLISMAWGAYLLLMQYRSLDRT